MSVQLVCDGCGINLESMAVFNTPRTGARIIAVKSDHPERHLCPECYDWMLFELNKRMLEIIHAS